MAVTWTGVLPLASVLEPGVPVLDAAGQPLATGEQAVPLDPLDFVTILVAGLDGGVVHSQKGRVPFADIPLPDVRGRTDTIMVLGLDRRTHSARILHIPRDTIVTLPGRGMDKMAHVITWFSFFELKKQVEQLLQFPINRYVLIDFGGFKELVDAIGGIEITVDHDLRSPDGVWLRAGQHHLDGAATLRLVRHRYGENAADLARIRLQKDVMVAVGRKLAAGGFGQALTAYATSPGLLKTNLSLMELVRLWREWRDFDPAGLEHLWLPGRPESHYWRVDPAGAARVIQEFWPDEIEDSTDVSVARREGQRRGTPLAAVQARLADLASIDCSRVWPLTYCCYLSGASRARPPLVLVYHTHTTESFSPELILDPMERVNHDPMREAFSTDPNLNVSRVGHELANALGELGLSAQHIATVHDPGGWEGRAGAYHRARETILPLVAAARQPVLVIDVHRDSVTQTVPVADRTAAGVLFVVARQNPWWQWNYTFTRRLDAALEAVAPGLSRGILITEGRYNEDLSPLAILVEIGGTDSTMEQCLYSARILAGVLADEIAGP